MSLPGQIIFSAYGVYGIFAKYKIARGGRNLIILEGNFGEFDQPNIMCKLGRIH